MNKSKISLKDAIRQGFAQVMGLPGISYQRRGKDGVTRYYTNTLDEVTLDGQPVDAPPAASAPAAAAGPVSRSSGGLDPDAVGFQHGEQSFTNEQLLGMAFAQSGLTKAEWNAQADEQIRTRVAELVDDMRAEAGAEAGAEGEQSPPAAPKTAEQLKLEGLRKAMDDAKAAVDANDEATPEGKAAAKKLKTAFTKAKNAYEKAAGLTG